LVVGSRAGGQHCDGVYHQPPIRSLLARHRFLNGLLTPKRQILKKARSPCTRGVNPEVATTRRIIAVYGLSRPEVHGPALKCLQLDIQPRRTRNPTRGSSIG